jgi:hypothetical protein
VRGEGYVMNAGLRVNRRDINYWAAIALFLPLYVQRVFIGGVGGEYSDYAGFSTWWIGYSVHLGFIVSALIVRHKYKDISLVFAIAAFILLSLIQVIYVSDINVLHGINIILPLIRSIIWITAIYIYCRAFFDKAAFIKAFFDITKISAFIVLICYASYIVTNIPFGVDIGRGVARAQGLFSEPSALAAVFPAFTILCFQTKKYWFSALGFLVVVIVGSVTVYFTFFVIIIMFLYSQKPTISKILIYTYVSIGVISTLFIQSNFIGYINDRAISFDASLNSQFGPSVFRELTVDRIISAINGLNNFVNQSNFSDLSGSGSSARLAGSIVLIQNMNSDGTYWTGYGVGVYGYVSNILYQSILDFGMLPFMISSFGAAAGVFAVYWLARSVMRIQTLDLNVYIVILGGLVGTLYNSAGGIHAYSISILAIFISSKSLVADGRVKFEPGII